MQLRSLRLAPFAVTGGQVGSCTLVVAANLGSVHLHDVDRDVSNPSLFAANQTSFQSSRLVTLAGCSMPGFGLGGVLVSDCERVVMSNSRVESVGSGFQTLRLERSTLVLLDSEVGGDVAIRACDAQLRLAGASSVLGNIWAFIDGDGLCQGASSVTVAPTAQLGTTFGGPSVTAAPVAAHGAFVDAARVLTIDVAGAPGGFGVLSFGEPLQQPVTLWGDLYWLDFQTVVVFDLVSLGAQGRAQWQAPVGAAVPSGASLWLQAATLDALGFTLAQPAVAITP